MVRTTLLSVLRRQSTRPTRLVLAALLSIVLTVAAAAFAPATPARAATPADTSSSTECQFVIGKATGPKHVSPVLSSQCAKPGERLTTAATNTLLMVWYSGYNYSGRSTKVYGVGGPCDSGGYGFAWVGTAWNDAIRAWKVFNSCNYSAAWEHINWGGFCKKYYGQVPNASAMDAEISSMWVSKGSWAWTLCG